MATKYKGRKGVTIIHLFNKEWRVGRLNQMKDGRNHIVIYSPEDAEFDLYGEDVFKICDDRSDSTKWESWLSWGPPRIDQAKAKIYILTSILDERENWCYDLNAKPMKDVSVKIVYHNGTIKRIKFSGEFENAEIDAKYYNTDGKQISDLTSKKEIKPVAWKIR